jgi:hypothetical protein
MNNLFRISAISSLLLTTTISPALAEERWTWRNNDPSNTCLLSYSSDDNILAGCMSKTQNYQLFAYLRPDGTALFTGKVDGKTVTTKQELISIVVRYGVIEKGSYMIRNEDQNNRCEARAYPNHDIITFSCANSIVLTTFHVALLKNGSQQFDLYSSTGNARITRQRFISAIKDSHTYYGSSN